MKSKANKQIQRTIDSALKYKRYLLTVREHHGNRYFYVNTKKKISEVGLYLLKDRIENGYYITEDDLPPQLELTQEQYNAIPEGKIKAEVLERLKQQRTALMYFKREKFKAELAQDAIKRNDGLLAFEIVYQDEHPDIEFHSFDEPKDEQ